jgi:hypothetical protein
MGLLRREQGNGAGYKAHLQTNASWHIGIMNPCLEKTQDQSRAELGITLGNQVIA